MGVDDVEAGRSHDGCFHFIDKGGERLWIVERLAFLIPLFNAGRGQDDRHGSLGHGQFRPDLAGDGAPHLGIGGDHADEAIVGIIGAIPKMGRRRLPGGHVDHVDGAGATICGMPASPAFSSRSGPELTTEPL